MLPTSHYLARRRTLESPPPILVFALLPLTHLIMSRDPLAVGNVIGDVIDPFVKSATLRVLYNNKEVTNGSELKPSMVVNEPKVEFRGRDMRTLYTLVSMLHLKQSQIKIMKIYQSSYYQLFHIRN